MGGIFQANAVSYAHTADLWSTCHLRALGLPPIARLLSAFSESPTRRDQCGIPTVSSDERETAPRMLSPIHIHRRELQLHVDPAITYY